MEERIRVSAVSYVNSYPFIFGLKNHPIIDRLDLQLDTPADCARKLVSGDVDLGLVPIAIIPHLKEYHIVSNKCIGSDGSVETVCLYSDVPLDQIQTVLLDYQSRTSVQLVQMLAQNQWNISPTWKNGASDFIDQIGVTTAGVVIGDRAFKLQGRFKFVYDLSLEWKAMTGLPFVFACWVSNRELDSNFISGFQSALEYGLADRDNALRAEIAAPPSYMFDYVNRVISYDFDDKKKEAMKLFLSWLSKSS